MFKTRARVRTGRDAIRLMAPQQLPLTVTDSAVRRIRVLRQKEKQPAASLRLRIIAGGCSGVQYRVDLAGAARPTDIVVAGADVKGFVGPEKPTYPPGAEAELEGGP